MSRSSERVKKWRKETKKRMVKAMGGACVCCGYKRCFSCLDLHHLDPSQKELSFGKVMAHPNAWKKIAIELRKCVLVCRNCHGEIHDGMRTLPQEFPKFDEEYFDYKININPTSKKYLFDICPICGKNKPIIQITCSRECAAKSARKVDWDNIDFVFLLKKYNRNWTHMGDSLGISNSAVRKRAIKLGLFNPTIINLTGAI